MFANEDTDLSLALVRAYNDWHIDEWCGQYPGRFIPMAVPVIWDVEQTAAEIRRVADKGCHSLSFTENPAALGYPSFHDDYWDPVWRACCDTGTVLAIHLGSSGRLSIPAVDSPPDVMITLQPMNIQSAAADLLWSRVIKKFPAIRIALSEGGTGWVPYFLERLDRTYEMHRAWTLQDFGDRLPSEVFREHFLTCFISDGVGIELRDRIGIDNIAWEADYPHSDSMWPLAPEELHAAFTKNGVTDDQVGKITHENAVHWFSFDPFSHVPRAEATVGALRAKAAGHDVSTMSRSTRVRTPDEKARRVSQSSRFRCRCPRQLIVGRRTPATRLPIGLSSSSLAANRQGRHPPRARGARSAYEPPRCHRRRTLPAWRHARPGSVSACSGNSSK